MGSIDLMRFLRIPAAFIGANFAGLACVLSVVGTVPGLAGNARVMSDLDEHADTSGMVVVRQVRRTLRRDLPVSLVAWLVVAAGAGTVWLMVNAFDGGTRVFFAGLLVPVYWVVGALLSAYVQAAGTLPLEAPRSAVVQRAGHLALTRRVRALLTVPLLLVLTPVWALAPLTVACGVSVPAWALGRLWGRTVPTAAQQRAQLDAERDADRWQLAYVRDGAHPSTTSLPLTLPARASVSL